MKNTYSLAVIGGDSRQLYAAQRLAGAGLNINVFACEHGKIPEFVNTLDSFEEAIESDVLVLPLPVSKNGKTLNTPLSSQEITIKSITDNVTDRHTVFYGMGSSGFSRQLKAKAKYEFDYFTSENLIYKNAYLTAEGILGIILDKLPVTIRGLKIAVTGYGRIGSFCADILKTLGADVYIYTGNNKKLVKAYLMGINGREITSLYDDAHIFDCIINTAPSQIIDERIIRKTAPNCLLIESASAPYGIDFDACLKNERQLIKAFSLPGKTAPKSAGIIIAETILEKLPEVNQ